MSLDCIQINPAFLLRQLLMRHNIEHRLAVARHGHGLALLHILGKFVETVLSFAD